jgi:hypothetical protein
VSQAVNGHSKDWTFDPKPLLEYFERLGMTSSPEIAAHVGVEPGTVRFWKRGKRRISFDLGDRIGVKLAGHPSAIWPEYWEMPMEDRKEVRKRRDRERKQRLRDLAKEEALKKAESAA